MTNRRNFIKSSAIAAGAVGLSAYSKADESSTNSFGVKGYSYSLPEFKKGSRLLFQGDSITDMKWGRNQKDRNHYLGHSYVYLIAARLGVELAEDQLDIYNRGISGNTVSDLRNRWEQDAIAMKPDLLSILIGTNDVGREVSPAVFETNYRQILKESRLTNPDLKLVLLDPFVLKSGKLKDDIIWRSRRGATDELRTIVASLVKEFDAVHVRMQEVFDAAAKSVSPEHWIWDGVHPLPQGHELIARHWLKEVSMRWPQK